MKKIKRKRLAGEKVLLEPFCLEKAKEFFELYQTSRNEWDKFITLGFVCYEQAKAYITRQINQDMTMAHFIIEKRSGKMVGFVLGDKFDEAFVAQTRAVGVAFEGQGFAYEAGLLFDKLARKAGFIAEVAFIEKENSHAIDLAKRGGFERQMQTVLGQGWGRTVLEVYCKPLR